MCTRALWKNPKNLTDRQKVKLADLKTVNGPLYRGYLLQGAVAGVLPRTARARRGDARRLAVLGTTKPPGVADARRSERVRHVLDTSAGQASQPTPSQGQSRSK